MSRLGSAIAYLNTHGLKGFSLELGHRLANAFYERWLGVHTARAIRLADIGIHNEDTRDSMPIGYLAFYSILKKIPADRSTSTFLDYGVGKGRAVCAAAALDFKRVIGIDISEVLIELAQGNLNRMKHRKTTQVELHSVDATDYEVPDDVNFIYFFNPFAGEILGSVIKRIELSWRRHPRKIHVVFFNNDSFDKMIAGQAWLSKVHQTSFYPEIACGLYETAEHADAPPA